MRTNSSAYSGFPSARSSSAACVSAGSSVSAKQASTPARGCPRRTADEARRWPRWACRRPSRGAAPRAPAGPSTPPAAAPRRPTPPGGRRSPAWRRRPSACPRTPAPSARAPPAPPATAARRRRPRRRRRTAIAGPVHAHQRGALPAHPGGVAVVADRAGHHVADLLGRSRRAVGLQDPGLGLDRLAQRPPGRRRPRRAGSGPAASAPAPAARPPTATAPTPAGSCRSPAPPPPSPAAPRARRRRARPHRAACPARARGRPWRWRALLDVRRRSATGPARARHAGTGSDLPLAATGSAGS